MSVDVPFESVQETAVKLARYEELFKHRYTEKDEGYRRIIQRGSRWYQVPKMHPWPPRKPYQHRKYEDWDSGHRRGYRHRGHERGWRSRHYHDDHRPPPWRHRSRSPRPDKDPYWDRSPHRSPRHRWGYDSPSPHHHPRTSPHRRPSPHHDYYSGGRRSRSKSRSPIGRPRWRSISPEGYDRREPKVQEEDRGPSGEALGGDTGSGDQAPPTSLLELGLSDSEPKQVPSDSDVLAILSSAHKSSSTVTSENLRHVQKVGHHAAGREKGRQRDKVAHSSKVSKTVSLPSSTPSIGLKVPTMHTSSSLLISHGKTENVSSLSVAASKDVAMSVKQAEKEQNSEMSSSSSGRKKGKKKKPQIVISDESDNEASVSVDNRLTLSTASAGSATVREPQAQHFAMTTEIGSQEVEDFDQDEEGEIVVDDNDSSSLVLHLNRRFYSTVQDSDHTPHSDTNPAMYTAVQSDSNATKLIIRSKGPSRTASPLTVDGGKEERGHKGGKKKKKKKSKHSKPQGEGGAKPLQLKITIAKLSQEPWQ